jgi:hypothetical protein
MVAMPDLTGVPHSVSMWLRGVAWAVKIKVEGWTKEEATFTTLEHYTGPGSIHNDR